MALSKHITHSGPHSGFCIILGQSPFQESTSYEPPEDVLGRSVGRGPENLHQYTHDVNVTTI